MRARDKTITFRLSSEQYERIQGLCLTMGVPSISELARAAVDKLIDEPTAFDLLPVRLELRVARLEATVDLLAQELRTTRQGDDKGPGPDVAIPHLNR